MIAVVSAATVSFMSFKMEESSAVIATQQTASGSSRPELNTTQRLLGYESKYGGLPDSLTAKTDFQNHHAVGSQADLWQTASLLSNQPKCFILIYISTF
jgi:hypothetical protein